MEESQQVLFKKRAGKKVNNVRRKDATKAIDEGDEGGSDINEVDNSMLEEIKFQQIMRTRKGGSSIEALGLANAHRKVSAAEKGKTEKEEETKTIESVMGTQYTVQVENGIEKMIPHKKLMDQYIEEQLGISKADVQQAKPNSDDDNLYIIPSNIKGVASDPDMSIRDSNGSSSQSAKVVDNTGSFGDESNGVKEKWSTGLAEVALPISFKMKNIEATEQAAAEVGERPFAGRMRHPIAATATATGGAGGAGCTGSVGVNEAIIAATTGVSKRMPYQRFMNRDRAMRMYPNNNSQQQQNQHQHGHHHSDGRDAKRAYSSSTAGGSSQQPGGIKRSQQSSDDYVMQQTKKRILNARR